MSLRLIEFFSTIFLTMELFIEVATHLLDFHTPIYSYFTNPLHILDICILGCSWAYIYNPRRIYSVLMRHAILIIIISFSSHCISSSSSSSHLTIISSSGAPRHARPSADAHREELRLRREGVSLN
jgi:hypothetical protein